MCSAAATGSRSPLDQHAPVHRPQGQPGHVRHRDEVAPLQLAEVEDVDDVGVAQAGGQRRFADEHVDQLRPVLQRRQHRLDDDALLEAGDALHLGAPDLRHAAGRQQRFDLVVAEPGPGDPGSGRGGRRRRFFVSARIGHHGVAGREKNAPAPGVRSGGVSGDADGRARARPGTLPDPSACRGTGRC